MMPGFGQELSSQLRFSSSLSPFAIVVFIFLFFFFFFTLSQQPLGVGFPGC